MSLARKLETFNTHTIFIAEFWNTISNIFFVIFGLVRLWEIQKFKEFTKVEVVKNEVHLQTCVTLYTLCKLFILAGICSGIHHACPFRGSIILDWIPIASSLYILCYQNDSLLLFISFPSWCKIVLALLLLISDHVWTPLPVPYGHVLWHIFAAFAVDCAYFDIQLSFTKNYNIKNM